MIGIRTDANARIAMGHVMRCLSIAKQLVKYHQEVIFILSENDAKELISKNGFPCICLNNHYDEKEAELKSLTEVMERYAIDRLIVDSYEVTEHYLAVLKEKVNLIYIDDINAFRYPVDWLINYSFQTNEAVYRSRKYDRHTKLLLGETYIPLREEFGGSAIEIRKRAESLLITTGGTDEFDMITSLIEKIDQTGCREMKKYIVAGKFYRFRDKLEHLREKDPLMEIYQDIPNMYEVMKQADIAVSAGGTTLAELCACGIPTICFTMADNQMAGAMAFADAGLMYYAGDVRECVFTEEDIKDDKTTKTRKTAKTAVLDNIVDHLVIMRDQVDLRRKMAEKMKKSIDGKGAKRIAAVLCGIEDCF